MDLERLKQAAITAIPKECKEYFLMNKDVVLMRFRIDGKDSMEYCEEMSICNVLPFWFTTIDEWVSNRSSAKHRKHVQEILTQCGGKTKSGFIKLTHCLSLNDTLWVKRVDESIVWDNVSLYKNDFNYIISRLSFEGIGLCGVQMSVMSPELSTDGLFDKCWIKQSNDTYLLKVGSTGASNTGLEPYSEVLASQVFEKLHCNSISYNLVNYHDKIASKCKLFTDEMFGFKSALACGITNTSLPYLLKEIDKYDDVDLFRGMLVGDSVTINTDRHLNNIGFRVSNETFEILGLSYTFDFNQAFFPYADWVEGFTDMDKWIEERGPKIGTDYYSVVSAIITPSLRADLINIKDLILEVDVDEYFCKERLKIINKFKNTQIDRLLGNRKQFGFEPYRY